MHDELMFVERRTSLGVKFGQVFFLGFFFLCLGLFLNGKPIVFILILFCIPGQIWIAMCDGCDMYLVLCACIIYTYNTKHAYIHSLYINFPYV